MKTDQVDEKVWFELFKMMIVVSENYPLTRAEEEAEIEELNSCEEDIRRANLAVSGRY